MEEIKDEIVEDDQQERGQLNLLSLPRELITEILKKTDPHTFETVARTSKELKEITEYDKIFDISLKCYNNFNIDNPRVYYIENDRLEDPKIFKVLSTLYQLYGKFEINKFNSEYSKIIFDNGVYFEDAGNYDLIQEFSLSMGEYKTDDKLLRFSYFPKFRIGDRKDRKVYSIDEKDGTIKIGHNKNIIEIKNVFNMSNIDDENFCCIFESKKDFIYITVISVEGYKMVKIHKQTDELIETEAMDFVNIDKIKFIDSGDKYLVFYQNDKIEEIMVSKIIYTKNRYLINKKYIVKFSKIYGINSDILDLDDMKFLVMFDDRYLKKINKEIKLNKGKLPDLIEEKDEIEETEERYELRKLKHVLENIFKYSFKIDKFKIFSIRQIEKM
jgi:hypothetical protein